MENSQNTKNKLVAQRYTTALVNIAEEKNQWDIINDDLTNLMVLIETNEEVGDFLLNPTVPVDDKKEIIEKSLKSELSSNVFNLLKLLLDKSRMYALSSINQLFKEELAKKTNLINAHVITAVPLEESLKSKLINKLEKSLEKKVNLVPSVDESIIGGVIIKVDDKVVDGSIKAQLLGLKKKLI